jgi:adenylate cyclase
MSRRIRLVALGLGLAASLAALALQLSGILQPVELVATDLLMRARGKVAPDPRVMVCDIDAASIERYGRWPWSRARVAELIDRLEAGGPRVVAIDVLFAEPSRADAACDLTREDQALAASLARAGNVVLGYFFRRALVPGGPAGAAAAGGSARPAGSEGDGRAGGSAALPASLARTRVEEVSEPAGGFALPRRPAAAATLDLFAAAADSQGFFSHERESGVLRHYQLLVACGDGYFPALALRAVQRFRRAGPLGLAPGPGNLPAIRIGRRQVGSDEAGRLWLDYRGPARTFPTVPAWRVLAGELPPGLLRGRLVFVGASEPGVGDLQSTPFGAEIAGVEVHANAADNLLGGRGIQDSGLQGLASALALLALGPLVALMVVSAEGHFAGSALAIGAVVAWPAASFLAFTGAGWHLQVVTPMAAGVLALVAALRYRVGFVEKNARQIKKTFQRYVSGAVVDEMLRHPERVKLGGERRDMTVLFSDIRGFTSISETLASEELVRLLNEFFTPMTRIVLEHGGTLDKYMGDALMAFFGAPLVQPDHAARACRAALAMRGELVRLNAGWQAAGRLPPEQSLGIGIGINSGEMAVGNIGSEAVFGYTVIGDNVNLGSRIEGLNKLYHSEAIVAEATASAAGPGLLLRELDRVQVKGKHVPIAIYELMSALPAAPADEERAALYAAGLAAYRAGDFTAAAAVFGGLVERFGDGPARTLHARCARYRVQPPPAGWDGVEVLTAK